MNISRIIKTYKMKKINLYRSDDILLILGKVFAFLLFVPILFTTIYLFMDDMVNFNTPGLVADLIMISTPVFLIIMGKRIRKEEEKVLAVWNILVDNPEVFIGDIESSTHLNKTEIIDILKTINMRRIGYYVYDHDSDSIINGRLRRQNIVIKSCPGCGQMINQSIPMNLSCIPKCPYCNNPIDIDYLNNEKNKIIDEIINESRESEYTVEKRKFSIFVVILLLIFFWPGAIIYIIVKTRK